MEVTSDGDAFNPAFDVTPAELITAIFTEAGVLESPYHQSIARIGS
jgi:methylthioribose-1-phosphate isomerase